ncbi:hypothetical protein QAD02_020540 [Eretmocerus hayati]|uniref:Uncharacterized protein n=1 Tax=Eretmocerus hayati TaxID=131215 RepID=A0ACC2PQW9_9HYME|nr:hypothetical protein QAD02_020540 [Eretmocerus hayati]
MGAVLQLRSLALQNSRFSEKRRLECPYGLSKTHSPPFSCNCPFELCKSNTSLPPKNVLSRIYYGPFSTLTLVNVVRRKNIFYSGNQLDLAIEQVFMRTMEVAGGLTHGRGKSGSVLTRFIMSMIVLTDVTYAIEFFCSYGYANSEQFSDDRKASIKRDAQDLEKNLDYLTSHNPFDVDDTESVISISTGLRGDERVNCHQVIEVGKHLPPTSEAAKQHIFRAYFQIQLWFGNDTIKATDFGWFESTSARVRCFKPVYVEDNILIPPKLTEQIICGCERGCANKKCSCVRAGMPCTYLCRSSHGTDCENINDFPLEVPTDEPNIYEDAGEIMNDFRVCDQSTQIEIEREDQATSTEDNQRSPSEEMKVN